MEHFAKSEFTCPCGCGLGFNDIDYEALETLIRARRIADVPFIINSSIRCKYHNKRIGGSHTSSHLKGLAFDINCTNSKGRFHMIDAFIKAGFMRIGIRKDFIHVDLDHNKPQCLSWVY